MRFGSIMKVIGAFKIAERGVGLFLDCARFDAPKSLFSIEVISENGSLRKFKASKEYARRVPPGEVEAIFVPGASQSEIPVGSMVRVIWDEGA